MKYIEDMIQEDITHELEMLDKSKDEYSKMKEDIINKYGRFTTTKRITGWDGKGYSVLVDEYQDYIEKYKYYHQLWSMYGYEGAKERIKKDVEAHYKTLQTKVEKKIGKIIKIEKLGGFDYNFEGELGKCAVEVILAGGYNIQRRHTRWIIRNVINY